MALAIAMAMGVSGCSPVMYRPNSHLAPLFRGPGEVHAWARLGMGSPDASPEIEGEVQAAFSPLNHVGVFMSAAGGRQHRIGEVGAGTYVRVNSRVRAELLLGYGQGKVNAEGTYRHAGDAPLPFPLWVYAPGERYRVTADYERIVAQANIGLDVSSTDVLGAAVRVSEVRLFNIDLDRLPQEDARGHYLEPAVFARIRRGIIGTEGQVGYSIPLRKENQDRFEARTFYLSMGLHLRIDALYQRLHR